MKNIVLIGMPGCGKSTFGKILSEKLHRKFFDGDVLVQQREGKTIPEMFAISESYFRRAETETLRFLAQQDGAVIATGGGAVINEENMRLLRENGVIVFIDRKPEKIISCISCYDRPLLADDKLKIFRLYEERIELYKKYADYIIGNNGSSAVTIEQLLKYAGGQQ